MRIDVVTIFPDMFEEVLGASIVGIAQDRGLLSVTCHDLRQWTADRHRTTDDEPYGGGPGMVMKPEPIFEAVESLRREGEQPATVVFFTPGGTPLDQPLVQRLAKSERLILVCGRYEGFDERALTLADLQVSIGDYILTGGELPAMVTIDAVARLLPGVLGDDSSSDDESFSDGLLEYPQYTRPAVFRGMEVPEVLRSGDHGRIARWRREQSVMRTATVRPDLLETASLTEDERRVALTLIDPPASRGGDEG